MSLTHFIFGRLGLHALPFWDMLQHPTHENIVNGIIATTAAGMVVVGAARDGGPDHPATESGGSCGRNG